MKDISPEKIAGMQAVFPERLAQEEARFIKKAPDTPFAKALEYILAGLGVALIGGALYGGEPKDKPTTPSTESFD